VANLHGPASLRVGRCYFRPGPNLNHERYALKGFSTPRSIHPLDVTADRAGLGRR
jgi:hypothetical protein